MTEHPIIFNSEMVKAILDGKKSQTRRVIKPQPNIHTVATGITHCTWRLKPSETLFLSSYPTLALVLSEIIKHCPYGQVGDRLWVKETHKFTAFGFALNAYVEYKDGQSRDVTDSITDGTIVYNQDHPEIHKWKPSIHMPRWASRLTLEITDIRVERLQEISREAAASEGIRYADGSYELEWFTPHAREIKRMEDFSKLWDSLNAKRGYGWESNPFCWVISFKVIL